MATYGEEEIRDEDRLPWLETVDEDYKQDSGVGRTALLAALGLLAIAAAIFLVSFLNPSKPQDGKGELIAAQEGDYKVKPDSPGGMKVEGEGDTAFATSEGKNTGGAAIDLKAMPESPIAGRRGAAQGNAPKVTSAIPASGGKLKAPPPMSLPGAQAVAVGVSGGALVQLGSFPDASGADITWKKLSKRFGYLAPLGKSVVSANVNGRNVWRLRVNAGSADQATTLCAKLKVAGEACFVPNE